MPAELKEQIFEDVYRYPHSLQIRGRAKATTAEGRPIFDFYTVMKTPKLKEHSVKMPASDGLDSPRLGVQRMKPVSEMLSQLLTCKDFCRFGKQAPYSHNTFELSGICNELELGMVCHSLESVRHFLALMHDSRFWICPADLMTSLEIAIDPCRDDFSKFWYPESVKLIGGMPNLQRILIDINLLSFDVQLRQNLVSLPGIAELIDSAKTRKRVTKIFVPNARKLQREMQAAIDVAFPE